MKYQKNPRGVAALLTVIIVGAAVLIMGWAAAHLGLGELDQGYTAGRGSEALSVADGCMEETMRRMRLNSTYGVGAGTINLTVSNGSCTIDVADTGDSPEQRQIDVTGTSGDYNKHIRVALSLTTDTRPVITVTSWEERSD